MLNDKPVVILDCDDVVCQCLKGMADVASAKIGVPIPPESLKTWDFFDSVKHPDHPDLKEHVELAMSQQGFCANLEPFPGAVEGVSRLKEIAEVFFCTAPYKGPYWPHERREWLERKFNVEHWRIIQASTKFLIRGELFIDDKVSHVQEWHKYGAGYAGIWDRPHNHNQYCGTCLRFHNWDEVFYFVKDVLVRGAT